MSVNSLGRRTKLWGLALMPLGLCWGLALSLYAFHPILTPPPMLADPTSLPRRLLRLAHIAAVMLPLITVVVAERLDTLPLSANTRVWVSRLLLWPAVGLPMALAAEALVAPLQWLHPSGAPAMAFTAALTVIGWGAAVELRQPHRQPQSASSTSLA